VRVATPRVILLHGLWMRAALMWRLAARLRAAGFAVETIDYPSILGGPVPCIERVAARLQREDATDLHLVGHSLGGVIAVRAAYAAQACFRGRIVCLGSPLAGSSTAKQLVGARGVRAMLLGQSAGVLSEGAGPLPPQGQVGVIAGSTPLGLGRLFHRFDGENDGTVALAETRLPGLAAHTVIASSHTGLVYSAQAAAQAIRFLREGRFDPG
jgi:pimeloyl-ACP methyl ester carboxylesterase